MGVIDALREKIRTWLLTEEERQIVRRVDDAEDKVDSVHSEWVGLQRALEDVEVVGEHEIESPDILVLTGHSHQVTGVSFGGGVYISGNHHYVEGNTLVPEQN